MMLQHMTLRHMALWRCGRSPMAKCSRNAFPGIRQWQYARAMRSRAAIRGNFCALCIPKGAWDGKRASRIMHGTRILPSDVDERREPPATTMPPPPAPGRQADARPTRESAAAFGARHRRQRQTARATAPRGSTPLTAFAAPAAAAPQTFPHPQPRTALGRQVDARCRNHPSARNPGTTLAPQHRSATRGERHRLRCPHRWCCRKFLQEPSVKGVHRNTPA